MEKLRNKGCLEYDWREMLTGKRSEIKEKEGVHCDLHILSSSLHPHVFPLTVPVLLTFIRLSMGYLYSLFLFYFSYILRPLLIACFPYLHPTYPITSSTLVSFPTSLPSGFPTLSISPFTTALLWFLLLPYLHPCLLSSWDVLNEGT